MSGPRAPSGAPPSGDDLFAPTLGGRTTRREGSQRPWRLGSQVYVAFFGGALALTVIAAINAVKLGLDPARIAAIVVAGLLAFAGAIAAGVAYDGSGRNVVVRLPALAAYGVAFLVQRQADRVYSWADDREEDEQYASLWVPGLAAVLAGGILQALLIVGLGEDGA